MLRAATLRHRSSTSLVMAGMAAALGLSGCDKDVGASGPARLTDEERASLRAEVKKSLEAELRPEVIAELKRELAPEVRAQLLAEHPPTPVPMPAVTPPVTPANPPGVRPDAAADADPAGASDAGPGSGDETPGPSEPLPGAGDIWSQPGTHIWPSAGGLKLVELVVGTALDEKLPTDVREHYPNVPEILYCYSVFENPLPDATVTHVWRRGSRLVSRVELEVGNSPKWRTWSKQRTQPHWTGLWSCEVLGEDGRQLGLTVFQIGG